MDSSDVGLLITFGLIAAVIGGFSYAIWVINQPTGQPIDVKIIKAENHACIFDDGTGHRDYVYQCLYDAGEHITVQKYNNGLWRIQ